MSGHPIWALLIAAAVIWYSTITIYVAIRGTLDVRNMLRRLSREDSPAEP